MLVKIDSMLEEIDSKYGPYILEELQKRIEFTIEEFFNDLKIVLENVFDKSNSLSVNQDNNQMETPVFIAEHNKKELKRNKYSVLDGELAVPCNLKSAICRIEFQLKGV